jgi:4-carboxymuconolactone decarboxylase
VSELFDRGIAMRRRVLGDEYVDRQLANADPESIARPLQELVTEYCWGATWNREAIDPKTRSLLTLAMLIALDFPDEIKIHTRGALNNGATPEEIAEVAIHSAIYCGVPAALNAMKSIKPILDEAS